MLEIEKCEKQTEEQTEDFVQRFRDLMGNFIEKFTANREAVEAYDRKHAKEDLDLQEPVPVRHDSLPDHKVTVLAPFNYKNQGVFTARLENVVSGSEEEHRVIWRVEDGGAVKIQSDLSKDQLSRIFTDLVRRGEVNELQRYA